jgi:spermidine synthase
MEVISTHLLVVIVGNSAYAFGLILAAFLLSLFAGAALAPVLSRRARDAALAYSLAFSALAVALTLPLWDDLPFAFGGLGEYVKTFAGREAMRAVVAFGILVGPATCMGLTFPLVLRWAAAHHEVGRFVGKLTAVNTAGAVAGALGTGYMMLPALGSERSLLLVALLFAGAAALTAVRKQFGYHRIPLLLSGASVTVAFLAPNWDVLRLTAGTNVYFDRKSGPESLLHVREDVHGGVTTVTLNQGVRTLYTNGKFQGNDGWELNAQRYFAHYPCLFVRSFDDALVIGLGTGTTLGTLAVYPWKRIDVLEISPAIVEAARNYFPHTNRHALDDPRVHVNIDDARNHLLVTDGRYSIITMELSSVWFAGASSLYSSEFYRLIRAHLTDDGVYQQWVQMHHIHRPVFAALVNTLRREFEHVALFYGGGQGILVSSKRPLEWSKSKTDGLSDTPEFVEMRPNGRPLSVLTDDILAVDVGLDRFIADSAREAGADLSTFVSNDDNLFLEYHPPRGNGLPWIAREELVAVVRSYRDEQAVAALDTDLVRVAN